MSFEKDTRQTSPLGRAIVLGLFLAFGAVASKQLFDKDEKPRETVTVPANDMIKRAFGIPF